MVNKTGNLYVLNIGFPKIWEYACFWFHWSKIKKFTARWVCHLVKTRLHRDQIIVCWSTYIFSNIHLHVIDLVVVQITNTYSPVVLLFQISKWRLKRNIVHNTHLKPSTCTIIAALFLFCKSKSHVIFCKGWTYGKYIDKWWEICVLIIEKCSCIIISFYDKIFSMTRTYALNIKHWPTYKYRNDVI